MYSVNTIDKQYRSDRASDVARTAIRWRGLGLTPHAYVILDRPHQGVTSLRVPVTTIGRTTAALVCVRDHIIER